MVFNLEESDKNILVKTNKGTTVVKSSNIFPKRGLKIKQSKYRLKKSIVKSLLPTTNGFNLSSFDHLQQPEEPKLLLKSLDLNNDVDHQLILELKYLSQKIKSYLTKQTIPVYDSYIKEIVYFDNLDEEEKSFEIEILLSSEYDLDKIFELEEEIWDYIGDQDKFKLPNGENFVDVKKRVNGFILDVKIAGYQTVLIVTHEAVLQAVNALYSGKTDEQAFAEKIGNAMWIHLTI